MRILYNYVILHKTHHTVQFLTPATRVKYSSRRYIAMDKVSSYIKTSSHIIIHQAKRLPAICILWNSLTSISLSKLVLHISIAAKATSFLLLFTLQQPI